MDIQIISSLRTGPGCLSEISPCCGYNKAVLQKAQNVWDVLAGLSAEAVCRSAIAEYDRLHFRYMLKSFGHEIAVDLKERNFTSPSREARSLLLRKELFWWDAALWYLAAARDFPESGRLVKPVNLKGGQIFMQGSHVLPLEDLGQLYDGLRNDFVRRGEQLGGGRLTYGDASVRIYPFPRIPVTVILWCGDDEFPPRTELLFDSTCEYHLPVDVLWSIAMLCIDMMASPRQKGAGR